MPKITETTVAEHRAAQHRAVLEAAERLIVNNRATVPTLAEVAAEVGLARPSIYRYVSSQQDLLVQLLIQATQAWNEQLKTAMQVALPEPTKRIRAYVDTALTGATRCRNTHPLCDGRCHRGPAHLRRLTRPKANQPSAK